VNRTQMEQVLSYLKIGADEGVTVAAQAPLPTDPELAAASSSHRHY